MRRSSNKWDLVQGGKKREGKTKQRRAKRKRVWEHGKKKGEMDRAGGGVLLEKGEEGKLHPPEGGGGKTRSGNKATDKGR